MPSQAVVTLALLVPSVALLHSGAHAFTAPLAAGRVGRVGGASRAASATTQLSAGAGAFGTGGFFGKKPEVDYMTPKSEYANTPGSLTETEELIGEIMVTDDASASKLADDCILEAERLFTSKEGWKGVLEQDGVFVEQKDLHGAFGKSGVKLVRGVGIIDASAEDFYKFQVSREGFQAIDEYLVNHRNVGKYTWETEEKNGYTKDDYELMMNRVEWQYPTKTREFVALDTIDRKRKILISKSALHPDRPGGSRYQDDVPLDEDEFVRAVQYYASKVDELEDGRCLLTMVTWGEMCDSYSSWWVNKFNAHVFITPKFERFKRAMQGEDVFELSDIVKEAWKLPALLMVKPDTESSNASDFVKKEMDKAAAAREISRDSDMYDDKKA